MTGLFGEEEAAPRSKKLSDAQIKWHFEIWWQHVWRKVKKPQALKAYIKRFRALESEVEYPAAHLLEKAKLFAKSDSGRAGGEFEGYTPPHPSSWLNGERDLEDPAEWVAPAKRTRQERELDEFKRALDEDDDAGPPTPQSERPSDEWETSF